MASRGKKGKTEIQKFEYLKNEKSFLDDIKSIFLLCFRKPEHVNTHSHVNDEIFLNVLYQEFN